MILSFFGGFFKNNINGEYAIQMHAITTIIHSKPISLTINPLDAATIHEKKIEIQFILIKFTVVTPPHCEPFHFFLSRKFHFEPQWDKKYYFDTKKK
jgi:hypothetical protein